MLAGYTILRILGQACVGPSTLPSRAAHRLVAIKVLQRDVDEPKVWERFLREARWSPGCPGTPTSSPSTPPENAGGSAVSVTEYLDRGSLCRRHRRRGTATGCRDGGVGVSIADALAAAHRSGISTAYVKPGNVLLGRDGRG